MRMKKNSRKAGQSLMEFALVIFIFLNLLVVTYNSVLAFATQQYLSYVAFLSARAFQASSENPEGQQTRAQTVLDRLLPGDRLQVPKFNRVLAYNIKKYVPEASSVPYGTRSPTPAREVRIQFEVPLFQLPFFSLSENFPSLYLEARSYLGREPTRAECRAYFQRFYNYFLPTGIPTRGVPEVSTAWTGMDDNDC